MFRPICLAAVLPLCLAATAAGYNMKVTADGIRLGKPVAGPAVSPSGLKGRVVVMEFWGVNCPPCRAAMPHLAKLNTELSPFGAVFIGAHVQRATPAKIKSVAASTGANFAIFDGGSVRGGTDFRGIPHTMVFGHDGKCVYRGHPMRAEAAMRKAVGASLAASAGSGLPSAVAAVADSLRAGKSPESLLPRLRKLAASRDEATAKAAGRLIKAMTDAATEPADTDLLSKYHRLRDKAKRFKGTAAGNEAAAEAKKMLADKATVAKLYALKGLRDIEQLDALMRQRGGSADPKSAVFRRAFIVPLKKMRQIVGRLKQKYPDEEATQKAAEIAGRYGLTG